MEYETLADTIQIEKTLRLLEESIPKGGHGRNISFVIDSMNNLIKTSGPNFQNAPWKEIRNNYGKVLDLFIDKISAWEVGVAYGTVRDIWHQRALMKDSSTAYDIGNRLGQLQGLVEERITQKGKFDEYWDIKTSQNQTQKGKESSDK